MTRTQVLQEIRRMRFEEACGGWQEHRLGQEEAARLPGVCERTFRRYVDRYEDEGLDGLADKRLGQHQTGRLPPPAGRIRMLRWRSTSPTCAGWITVVESRWVMTAGPGIRFPGRSRSRS